MTALGNEGKGEVMAIDWTKEGECTKCRRLYRLAKDGSIWFHYKGARNSGKCEGAGLPPAARRGR